MKRHAPATARNGEAIGDVLARELPAKGIVLEIASGTGEHAVRFARRFPQLTWQPSDLSAEVLDSIAAYREEASLANLLAPVVIDASAPKWSVGEVQAVLCINMVHISPWEVTEGLLSGAGNRLGQGEPLILYGPYRELDVPTASSNAQFELSLKERDERFGLRQREDVDALAEQHGFVLAARHDMPANNLMLIYRKP
ncbi:DUF938 domain-containing protein [Altererythrobacter sp. MF3-039]|uniref:DUF938 domain-containing protein n=1 Tax=Altererythrobacter sp. MF3-039 TaxID=3252901 RepID=UPI00390C5F72